MKPKIKFIFFTIFFIKASKEEYHNFKMKCLFKIKEILILTHKTINLPKIWITICFCQKEPLQTGIDLLDALGLQVLEPVHDLQ